MRVGNELLQYGSSFIARGYSHGGIVWVRVPVDSWVSWTIVRAGNTRARVRATCVSYIINLWHYRVWRWCPRGGSVIYARRQRTTTVWVRDSLPAARLCLMYFSVA